jgi:hypothetical protein
LRAEEARGLLKLSDAAVGGYQEKKIYFLENGTSSLGFFLFFFLFKLSKINVAKIKYPTGCLF